jgi:hypothetical protein
MLEELHVPTFAMKGERPCLAFDRDFRAMGLTVLG